MDSQPSQEVTDLLKQWEEQNGNSSWDPIPILTRLAEIIEMETENFMKKDPDPFDERHPSRTDPSCALGHALKVMFKKDNFMTKLVNDYVRETYYTRPTMVPGKDVRKLNIAACRLTLDLMPGLEMSVVFQDNEGLIHRLYGWAEKSVEPLQTYATGLLAAAMEVQDIAGSFRDQNARLVPLMLKRLHKLRRRSLQSADPTTSSASSFVASSVASPVTATSVDPSASAEGMSPSMDTVAAQPVAGGAPGQTTRHFARFATSPQQAAAEVNIRKRLRYSDAGGTSNEDPGGTPAKKSPAQSNGYSASSPLSEGMMSPPPRGMVACKSVSSVASVPADSASNSSWAEMETYVIGNIQIHPPTDATRQMLILRYLTPMGEYQEFLSHVFAENALELILGYVNLRESRDSRLAFEALKYLAALLCHKKFSIEFINMNGLQRFLEVPRPSVAATGVSICLYYLAYCEDAMERVCLLPRRVLADLVRYALWLLECSHDSGRCHATMFFGFCFQFRVILEEFDNQDGLRKLYNVISTLPILSVEDDVRLSEDESCAARQIVRHVCVALKRYIESHLHHRAAALRRQERPLGEMHPQQPAYKACKSSPEEIQEQIERLQAAAWTKWAPCDQLLRLGGVTLLLQIVAFSYEWNFNGRAETVRSALDVISACCVAPRAQLLLCEKVDMPDDGPQVGVNIVLAAAEGEIVPDADVQKAALNVIVNCVCSPVHRVGGASARFSSSGSTKKKTNLKSYEDVIQKVWESVRTNNGIMVLLQLMLVKSPITDADCLRGLACRALAGLARCPTVRQIISKLPLFTTEQMQSLMRDPILQEKRQEHVMFQKYALELMERVSELIERVPSKHKASGGEFETSLANIHRANVVAQTHIKFNERQLFQLIYQHLAAKGLTKAAEALRKEAALAPLCPAPALAPPHLYQGNNTPTTPSRLRPLPHGPPRCSASSATASTSAAPEPSSSTSMVNGYINEEPLATPLTPHTIKIRRCQSTSSPSPILGMVAAPPCPPATPSRSLQKAQSLAQGPGAGGGEQEPPQPRISLDNIITEYLANQHALCKNPMVTCAEFNLFQPHKCPDGQRNIRSMATNSAVRHALRQAGMAPLGRHDYRHVHSHFCSLKTFRLQDDDSYFTCCLFHPTQKTLLAGTSSGDVKFFNLFSGQEESSYQLHDSYISHIQASRDGTLLLGSSSTWRNPTSALWNMKNCEMKVALNDEDYVEFSKLSEDKIIGTKAAVATIYDTATGRSLATLKPSFSNLYSKNRATFSPTDELVLSDGVLWDVNGGTEIHKFDKLNQSLSGVFHPNGLEIISNTEVWDLRTFHLLRTVPILDKSEVVFSPLGGILYSIFLEQDGDDKSHYESSFKTLDSHDYSSIATIDVKRNIYALGVAGWGGQVALAENTGGYDTVQESVLKLYDVGRQRDQDDEVDEEDEEEMGNSDNEGSDSASDDASAFRNALAELGLEGGSADDDDDPDDDDEDDDDQDGDDDLDDLGPLLDSDESISDRSWRPARRRARRAPRGQDRRQRREPARRQSNNEEEEEDEESDADSAH